MSFKVDPSAVADFARELSVIEASSASAVAHAGYTNPSASGGALLLRLMENLADVEDSVRGLFSHLEAVLAESGDELRLTVTDYRRTDDAAEARSDKQYGRL